MCLQKLEASRTNIRSDVDFVITFEELAAMFDAKEINLEAFEGEASLHNATGAGRGYAVAGGVAGAIESCLKEYYPDISVHIEHAESLAECKKVLTLAKAGKLKGCMIEGMACPRQAVWAAPVPTQTSKNLRELWQSMWPHLPEKSLPKELEDIQLN